MARPTEPNGRGAPPSAMFPELELGVPSAAQPAREPRVLSEWVAHIRDQEMPALGVTVDLIHSVTDDEKATTGRLAQAILQDAAMTAKVLKLANSAMYNTARQPVNTISRAIVVLGFNAVAEIAVAIQVIDALLAGGVRQRVLEEMARGFHAAVQARSLATMRRDSRAEEVFIAALLSRVGEMAFWCFGGSKAQRLSDAMAAGGQSPDDTQMSVLGFRLKQLSQGLAREWKLPPLLQTVLEGSTRLGPTEQAILYGQRLANEAEKGWDAPGTRRLIGELASFVGGSAESVREELAANSIEAARIAGYFGAAEAGRQIPQATPGAFVEEPEPEVPAIGPMVPDPQLQLKILREISGRIAAGASLNEILQLVLEGVYRGVGFDRVLFALLSANRLQLIGKVGLGAGAEALRQQFIFSLDKTPGDFFNEFFRAPRALRFDPAHMPAGLRVDRLQLVTNADVACVAPILANGRAIGLFYADRVAQSDAIDDEAFDAFQLFVQQVSLAVSAVAQRQGQ